MLSQSGKVTSFVALVTTTCLFAWSQFSGVTSTAAVTKRPSVVKIGVILPFEGDHRWALPRTKPGIEYAVEYVRRHILPSGVVLQVVYGDSRCSDTDAPLIAIDMHYNRSADVFIGPACDYAVAPIARFSPHWNIPVITGGALVQAFSDKSQYRLLTRISGSYAMLGRFVADLFAEFGWVTVQLIYNSNLGPRQRLGKTECFFIMEAVFLLLQVPFRRRYVGVELYNKAFDEGAEPGSYDFNTILLEASTRSRIIIMCANADSIREIMITAAQNKFDNGDYVFFNIDLFSSKSQLEQPWKVENDTSERNDLAKRGFQALKTITLRKPDSNEYKQFSDEVKRMAGPDVYGEEEVNSFVGAFHDAVILYALAVNETLADNMDPRNGTDITRRMWNRSFQGITGNVTIDENGDRNVDYSLLDMDPVTEKFQVVANYFGSRQFYEPVSPNMKIHWAGNRTSPPSDTPACGYNNEKCKPFPVYVSVLIALVCLLVTSLAVALLIYRRWKLSRELAKIVIKWKDIIAINCAGQGCFDVDSRQTLNHRPSLLALNIESGENQLSNIEEKQLFTKAGAYKTRVVAIKDASQTVHWSHTLALECKKLKDLQHDHINRFIGICIDRSCIITEYCPRGSLMDVLGNENLRLDEMFKLSLIQDIVNGMLYLHNSDIRSHGSLKSSNCVVDSRFALKITDFGLPSLRSSNGYTKNFTRGEYHEYSEYYAKLWTAPELLRADKFLVQGTQKGDIYSFAIICQEIIVREGTFWRTNEEFNPEEIYWLLRCENGEGRIRPTLPDDCTKSDLPIHKLNSLIRRCWKEESEERPDFHVVKSQIKQIYKDSHNGGNLLDNLLNRMQQYATNLESLVDERTAGYLREKKRAEDLLYQMLPRSIAEELMEKNRVKPVRYDNVTIYFSDIVQFTLLTRESEPMEIVTLLNDLYCLFDGIIRLFNVYKVLRAGIYHGPFFNTQVETIGDAYMVVSGLPVPNGNLHASEISRMALALLKAVDSFPIRHRPDLKLLLRIGIHSGSVCACVVGETMPRYCLVGDTVNTASRMESCGKELRIHVSPTTKAILDTFGTFVLRRRSKMITPKGLQPMYTWWLEGDVNNSNIDEGVGGLTSLTTAS